MKLSDGGRIDTGSTLCDHFTHILHITNKLENSAYLMVKYEDIQLCTELKYLYRRWVFELYYSKQRYESCISRARASQRKKKRHKTAQIIVTNVIC